MVQPRKTRPCLTERLLMGRKESNQTNKQSPPPTHTHTHIPLSAYLPPSKLLFLFFLKIWYLCQSSVVKYMAYSLTLGTFFVFHFSLHGRRMIRCMHQAVLLTHCWCSYQVLSFILITVFWCTSLKAIADNQSIVWEFYLNFSTMIFVFAKTVTNKGLVCVRLTLCLIFT